MANDKPMLLRSRMGGGFADRVYQELSTYYPDMFELGDVDISFFPNKEPFVRVRTNVAGRHVYLVHAFEGYRTPSSPSANYDPSVGTMSLNLINDALKRASVERNTNVLPHIPWLRGDRKDEGRVAISAKHFFNGNDVAGGDQLRRYMTYEMHSGQAQGFTERAIDNLYTNRLFAHYFRKRLEAGSFMVVAPDAGGGKRARDLAHRLDTRHIYADKQKDGAEKTGVTLIGNVDKRIAIIPDDMADTGSTLMLAADALRAQGVEEIYACTTHPVLSPKDGVSAEERFKRGRVKLVTTDSIPMGEEYIHEHRDWLHVIPLAPLTARAIYIRETNGSIQELFEGNFIDKLYADII